MRIQNRNKKLHSGRVTSKRQKLLDRLNKLKQTKSARPIRRAMATPLKKPTDSKLFFSKFKFGVNLLRNNLWLGVFAFAIVILLYVIFFSGVFKINTIVVGPESAFGCISESEVKNTVSKSQKYVWSTYFFDKQTFLKKYSCLKNVSLIWNPTKFNQLSVSLSTVVPVMRVKINTIDVEDRNVRQDELYTLPTLQEQVLYASANGVLLHFERDQSLFEIRYRIFKTDSVKSLRFDEEFMSFVYQLKTFFNREYKSDPMIDAMVGGTVRTTAPFADSVYFTAREKLDSQLGSLQAVLKQATINKSKIDSIDLRFGNPVVQFKK